MATHDRQIEMKAKEWEWSYLRDPYTKADRGMIVYHILVVDPNGFRWEKKLTISPSLEQDEGFDIRLVAEWLTRKHAGKSARLKYIEWPSWHNATSG